MAKRYYWLKLPDGFFRQKAIKKLRKIAGGDTYTIIYLKMLLVAMKQDGRLYFEGVEATFYDELALDLDEEVENVRVTVMFLIQQDLMQLIDETEYSLSECSKMTGSESASAERMRRLRDKKASQCDIEVTEQLRIGDVEKEIEKELEIEKETESDAEKELFPESQTAAAAIPETTTTTGSRKKRTAFSRPTLEEIRNYCIHRGSTVSAEQFYDYYEANGWNIGKHPMRDWKAALRTWERHEKPSCPDKPQPPLCENAEAYASFVYNLT